MTTHGGARWPEQARNIGLSETPDPDHRLPHKGPEPEVKSKLPTAIVELLLGYLSVHGDWDELSVTHGPHPLASASSQQWKFTPCECVLCQKAVRLVGHPERPFNG